MLAEEALIEGEENQFKEKYERMIKGSDSGVWAVDSDGETIMMNERMAEVLGRSEAEVIGHRSRVLRCQMGYRRGAWARPFRPLNKKEWERSMGRPIHRSCHRDRW